MGFKISSVCELECCTQNLTWTLYKMCNRLRSGGPRSLGKVVMLVSKLVQCGPFGLFGVKDCSETGDRYTWYESIHELDGTSPLAAILHCDS